MTFDQLMTNIAYRIAELEHQMQGEVPDGYTMKGSDVDIELQFLRQFVNSMNDTGSVLFR